LPASFLLGFTEGRQQHKLRREREKNFLAILIPINVAPAKRPTPSPNSSCAPSSLVVEHQLPGMPLRDPVTSCVGPL